MTDRPEGASDAAAEQTAAEAFKAQLNRLIADHGANPRIHGAALARRFREELGTVELTVLIADLSGELRRSKAMLVDAQIMKHHGRRLAALEAAIDVLRVGTAARG
jgi:hypothetical protein